MRDEAALVRALDALCLASIARFKRPRDYRFVDELPKNNAGKVLKTALREVVAGDPGAAPAGRDPAG
jgi:long-chain acyl-CoA synthetase